MDMINVLLFLLGNAFQRTDLGYFGVFTFQPGFYTECFDNILDSSRLLSLLANSI